MSVINMDQHQKIITLMMKLLYQKDWFLPQDFMQSSLGDLFVGYEASARCSELGKWYPELIESQKQGKYVARRIRVENMEKALITLPEDLKKIVNYYYVTTEYKAPTLF